MNTSIMKIHNSTEVIPIGLGHQGPSGKKNDPSMKNRIKQKHDNRPRSNNHYPYFGDPLIVPRVKQYLEEHSKDIRIDFEDMVNALQSKYRDYTKRKRSAFKGLVDKAYSAVLQEFSKTNMGDEDGDVHTSESSGGEDFYGEDGLDSYNQISGNKTNMQLMSMYAATHSRKTSRPKSNNQELINISSSEDEDEDKEENVSLNESTITVTDKTSIVPAKVGIFPISTITTNPAYNGEKGLLPTPKPILSTATLPSTTSTATPVRSTVPSSERTRKRKAAEMINGGKTPSMSMKKKREVPTQEPHVTFKDFGGNAKVLEEVCKLLVHVRHPEIYRQIGISPPRGFLLHGPPGCGKTLLAQAIAGELDVPLIKVASPELVAGVSGESEERIRDLFDQAVNSAPCVLFLDEVDAITPNRHTAQREMERRIVAQLLTCLDDLSQKENGDQVLVIGATNRPDALDPALRRAGRFDREVCLGIPDLNARIQILKVVCGRLRLAADLSFEEIARNTPGFVGADLMALTREAAMVAVNRVFGNLKKVVDVADEKEVEAVKSGEAAVEKVTQVDAVKPNKVGVVVGDRDANKDEQEENKGKVDKSVDDVPVVLKSIEQATEDDKSIEKVPAVQKTIEEVTVNDDASDKVSTTVDKAVNEEMKMEVCEDVPLLSETDSSVVVVKEGMEKKTSTFGPVLEELISWLHDIAPLTASQLDALHVEKSDFEMAMKSVQPSAKREGFATVPDVTWDDVGSLQDIRDELQMAILAPVRHPEQFAALGLTTPTGVLLCGPPGCGKTLLAKAVANEAGVNFISVKGPELLNMYVGESERAVRQCFQRARNSAPCVIFFDELDALCPKRSDSGEGGASMRVVNQMLTEMDGIEGRKGVYLMAATNRPDIVDPAVLRPGRLDKILYVGLPTGPDRVLILEALTKKGTKPTLAADVSLLSIGECNLCHGYTGADLAALVREAGIESLKEFLEDADKSDKQLVVAEKHFLRALAKIRPSVSDKDQKYYEKLREIYTAVPKH